MATVRDILDHHEAETMREVQELREKLAPLERELADIRRARKALHDRSDEQAHLIFHQSSNTRVARFYGGPNETPTKKDDGERNKEAYDNSSPYAGLTMKQLVHKALQEQFPNGATAIEMLDHFRHAWGRDIMRTSLSPQLSRLKQSGIITLNGKIWSLAYADAPEENEPPTSDAGGGSETGEGATSLIENHEGASRHG